MVEKLPPVRSRTSFAVGWMPSCASASAASKTCSRVTPGRGMAVAPLVVYGSVITLLRYEIVR